MAEMDQVVADYQAGMSSNAVGQKYGIDGRTVLNQLRVRGIEAREANRTVITRASLHEAVELRRVGWTHLAMGQRFGVSRVAATNALKRADQR